MKNIHDFLLTQLARREADQIFRSLQTDKTKIDFCSNDYLGFARSERLRRGVESDLQREKEYLLGSTGSRLISGNSIFLEELEQEIAFFHNAEAGLIFNSGYDANVGLFSSLAQRGDTVITDELIHASIIDGIRLSNANRYSFKHNNPASLEEKLRMAKGKIFIAVESVYSMDGDEAPLTEILDLADKYGAAVIVDEAHAIGVFGYLGKGLGVELGLENRVFARIITFGKSLGSHGAIVIGSDTLRNYLINFARSFIYTTASPFHTHLSIKRAYALLAEEDYQFQLKQKINLFKKHTDKSKMSFLPSRSPIQCLLIDGNENAKNAAILLQQKRFDVRAILYPTVPEGKERLRICLHTYNTDEEIKSLTKNLEELL